MGTMRLNSRHSFLGTLALSVAAIVATGVSPEVQAAGDKGRIRLQMGTANYFAYEAPTATGFAAPSLFQPFGVEGKGSCLLAWYVVGVANYAELMDLAPLGGASAAEPGFGPTSIGVYDGPKGTPCSRVSQYAGESLAFMLGQDTTRSGGSIQANAFDRLELDVEVKADAALQLVTYLGSVQTGRFYLQTGASITGAAAPPKSDGQPVDSSPALPVVSCAARSDSGPDSGPNDNCRWVIKDVIGQSFKITPLVGEFSLEGGGDWEGTNNYLSKQSLIYLTSVAEGLLACGGSTTTLKGATTCTVSGEPTGEYCRTPSIYYFFREVAGVSKGCEFIKASNGQLAASMAITFPPEPADLNATKVLFPTPSGGTVSFEPKLCTGTVVGLDGYPTIKEVLDTASAKPAGYVDQVPETPAADWACILDEAVTAAAGGYIQVYQRILFWGDPLVVRY